MKFSDARNSLESSSQYLKLKEGDNRIRIVSEPVMLWKAFNKAEKTAKVYLTKERAKTDPDARQRFMMYVINRENGDIQQAEFGASIINQLADLQMTEDYKFDSLPPYDITIRRTGSALDTEYSVLPARANTEITAEERVKIDALESLNVVLARDAEDGSAYTPF